MSRRHEAIEGTDFMPAGACGPAPRVCSVCSFDALTGNPVNAVAWPCVFERIASRLDGPRGCPRCSKVRTQLIGGLGDRPTVLDYCANCDVPPEAAWL